MEHVTGIRGGLSEAKPATPEIQHIVDQVKPEFERRQNQACAIFRAILYKSQVVSGLNYFIKVQDSEDSFVHLKVFEGISPENRAPSLEGFQTGKTRDDPLTYF
ncbi:cystatin-A-like [Pogoniulus pusillus]|uniref:cystatin-A-like n=1 Tax=Pogoniulus pusillus TaxID=488313 RepID=UPI0030B991A9